MNEAYLITGGNMGDRMNYLETARNSIEKKCGTICRQSSIYETQAWGNEEQGLFLNQVLMIHTALNAAELLKAFLQIEEDMGRKRESKYGPRTIDIDLLFFNDDVIDTEGLQVPHPQMQNRRFVLMPLHEIAPDKEHPLLHETVAQLLLHCADPLTVNKFC